MIQLPDCTATPLLLVHAHDPVAWLYSSTSAIGACPWFSQLSVQLHLCYWCMPMIQLLTVQLHLCYWCMPMIQSALCTATPLLLVHAHDPVAWLYSSTSAIGASPWFSQLSVQLCLCYWCIPMIQLPDCTAPPLLLVHPHDSVSSLYSYTSHSLITSGENWAHSGARANLNYNSACFVRTELSYEKSPFHIHSLEFIHSLQYDCF